MRPNGTAPDAWRPVAAGTRTFLLAGLLFSGVALAGAPSVEATLGQHEGKTVTLHLDDGTELSGKVAGLSPVTVKLTGLTGKEFYDAVVRLDRISAVSYRAKDK